MAVADESIIIIFVAIVNYLVIYRKNKILGLVGYLVIGLLMMLRATNGNIYGAAGMFIFAGCFISMIYEILAIMPSKKV